MFTTYICPDWRGGCGTVWTPVTGNRRPVNAASVPPAYCPDCMRGTR